MEVEGRTREEGMDRGRSEEREEDGEAEGRGVWRDELVWRSWSVVRQEVLGCWAMAGYPGSFLWG